jgi:hypothetical protein
MATLALLNYGFRTNSGNFAMFAAIRRALSI